MRKLFFVLTILLSFQLNAQVTDIVNLKDVRKIDWKFIVSNVEYVNDSTWTIQALPYDFADPGAENREVGNFVKDNINNIYKIINSTETTLTVVDLQFDNFPVSPQADQVARCYLSLNKGDTLFYAAGANNDFQFDEANKWKGQAINDELLARATSFIWDYMNPFEWVDFDTTLTDAPYEKGRLFWNEPKQTLTFYDSISGTANDLNQELTFWIYNNNPFTIPNGTIVTPYSGSVITLADNRYKDKALILAVTTHDISAYSWGKATKAGQVADVNTVGYEVGQKMYLGLNGQFTPDRPIDGAFAAIVAIVDSVGVNGVITVDIVPSELTVEVNDVNGIPGEQRDNTILSFNNANRTLSITPIDGEFHYYQFGEKFEKTGTQSIQISNTEGFHFAYYDGDTLKEDLITNLDLFDIFRYRVAVAGVYWNATTGQKEGEVTDERHGISMSPAVHAYLHTTRGTQFVSGGSLSNLIVDGAGALNSHAQFGIEQTIITDEDLRHTQIAKAFTEGFPIFYLSGANNYIRSANHPGYAFISGTTYPMYNQNVGGSWQLTELVSGDFMLVHIFMYNGITNQVISFVGQNKYTSKNDAMAAAKSEIFSLVLGSLADEEVVPIATVILEAKSNFTNTVHARYVSTETGAEYIDWRFSDPEGFDFTPTDHGTLTGLTDDDHPQYILANGTRPFTTNISAGEDADQPSELVRLSQLADSLSVVRDTTNRLRLDINQNSADISTLQSIQYWDSDAYGINYQGGNVGIGSASSFGSKLTLSSNTGTTINVQNNATTGRGVAINSQDVGMTISSVDNGIIANVSKTGGFGGQFQATGIASYGLYSSGDSRGISSIASGQFGVGGDFSASGTNAIGVLTNGGLYDIKLGLSGVANLKEISTTPSLPAAGTSNWYFKGGKPYVLLSNGTEYDLTSTAVEGDISELQDSITQQRSDISQNATNIAINQQAIIDSSASLRADIDLNTTHRLSDNDLSATNELQTISKVGSTVTLSNGGGSFTDDVDDADNSITNELQNLSLGAQSGTNIPVNISNGTGVTINVADNDNDSTNELQDISGIATNSQAIIDTASQIRADFPIVNNPTITLQRNGVSIGDFTLNQATPETFNFIDNNTTYSAGTGLSLSGTTFNHSNSITAGNLGDSGSSRTLAVGGTFTVPYTTYDAQGHITGNTNKTLTLPSTYTPSAHTLDSHSNMAIISNTAGEILQWNGSVWLNRTLAEAGVQPTLSLTTTGNSGAASLIGNVLNVPNYTLAGLGYTTPNLQQVANVSPITTTSITANGFISTTNVTLKRNTNASLMELYGGSTFSDGAAFIIYGMNNSVNKGNIGFTIGGATGTSDLDSKILFGYRNSAGAYSQTGSIDKVGNMTMNGHSTANRFVSTVATGTSPFSVASTTLNTNLNADLLDDNHGSYWSDFRWDSRRRPLSGLDLNSSDAYKGGISYWTNTTTNTPVPSSYGTLLSFVGSGVDHNGTSNWLNQIAVTVTNKWYTRVKINAGTYTTWREIWNSGNSNLSTENWSVAYPTTEFHAVNLGYIDDLGLNSGTINKFPYWTGTGLSSSSNLGVSGNSVYASSNNGSDPFFVTRLSNTNESLAVHIDDSKVMFESRQDENSAAAYGSMTFRIGNQPLQLPVFTVSDYRSGTDATLMSISASTKAANFYGDIQTSGTTRISSTGAFTGTTGTFSGTVSWGTPSSDANGKLSYGGTSITMEASEATQNTNILLRPSGTGKLYYNSRADNISREIYHSGNSNKSTVNWSVAYPTTEYHAVNLGYLGNNVNLQYTTDVGNITTNNLLLSSDVSYMELSTAVNGRGGYVGAAGIPVPSNGFQDYGTYLSANAYRSTNGNWYHGRTNTIGAAKFYVRGSGSTSTTTDVFLWSFSANNGSNPIGWTDLMGLSASGDINVIGSYKTNGTTRISSTGAFTGKTGTFSGQLISTVATGTAPFSVASTTLNTNLNANYLNGYVNTDFIHKTAYSFGNGYLVQTDIPLGAANMFTVEITGNGYTGSEKINISAQGYIFNNASILEPKGIADNYSGTIYYMIRSGYLWIWFPKNGDFQTYNITVFCGTTGKTNANRVLAVTNAVKPTDATIEVSFVPKQRYNETNSNLSTVNWSVANPTSSYHAVNLLSLQNGSLWADLDYLEINGTERISSTGDGNLRYLTLNTGTALKFDVSAQLNGTIEFGNAVTGSSLPSIQGKSTSLAGLFIGSASPDNNISGADMIFSTRQPSNIDFTTLTNKSYVFRRFGTEIFSIYRNGNTQSLGSATASSFIVSGSNNSTNWYAGYNSDVVSAAVTGTTTKTITFTKRDATTFSTNFTDLTGTSLWTDNSSSNYVTPATAGRGIRLGDGISSIYMKSDYPTSAGLGYLGMNYDGINQDFIQFDYLNGDIDIKGDVFMPDINGKTSETKVLYYNETTKEVTQGDLATATEATYTTLGVASFDSTDFEVYNGHVSDRYNKRLPNESFTAVGTTQDIGVFYSPGFEMYAKVSIAVTDVTSSDMSVYTAYVQAFFDNLTNSFNQSSVYPAHSYTNGAAITLVWVDYGNIGQLDCQLSGLVPDHEYNYSIKIEYFRNVTN